MLPPFIEHGETIYSFAFRMHSAFGINRFSNIINSDGEWTKYPKASKNTEFLYKPYGDRALLKLINNSGFGLRKYEVYGSPTLHLDVLGMFFGLRQNFRSNHSFSKKIRYCEKCIKDQVTEFGTGFFIKEWQIKSKCLLHNNQLKQIESTNLSQTKEAIFLILKGISPDKIVRDVIGYDHANDEQVFTNKPIYPFAQCLKGLFESWIENNLICLSDKVVKQVQIHKSYLSNAEYKQSREFEYLCSTGKYKQVIYEDVMTGNYESLEKLLSKHTIKIKVFSGLFEKRSLFGFMYKSKKEDCMRCEMNPTNGLPNYQVSECPGNLLIYKTNYSSLKPKICSLGEYQTQVDNIVTRQNLYKLNL
jgi:hypothetical protein